MTRAKRATKAARQRRYECCECCETCQCDGIHYEPCVACKQDDSNLLDDSLLDLLQKAKEAQTDTGFVFEDEIGGDPFISRAQELIRQHTLNIGTYEGRANDGVKLIAEIKAVQADGQTSVFRWKELEAIKLKIWKEVFQIESTPGPFQGRMNAILTSGLDNAHQRRMAIELIKDIDKALADGRHTEPWETLQQIKHDLGIKAFGLDESSLRFIDERTANRRAESVLGPYEMPKRDPRNLAGQTPMTAAIKEAPVKLDPAYLAQYISERIEALEAEKVEKEAEKAALEAKIDEAKTAIYNALNAHPEKFEYQLNRQRDQFTILAPVEEKEYADLVTAYLKASNDRDDLDSRLWNINRDLRQANKDHRMVMASNEDVEASAYDQYI